MTASSRALEARVELSLSRRALRVPLRKQEQLLGIHYASGKTVWRAVQMGRLQLVAESDATHDWGRKPPGILCVLARCRLSATEPAPLA